MIRITQALKLYRFTLQTFWLPNRRLVTNRVATVLVLVIDDSIEFNADERKGSAKQKNQATSYAPKTITVNRLIS